MSITTIHIYSNPMKSYWFVLIKINFIRPIPYFRQVVSWIITIKSKLLWLYIYMLKFVKGWGDTKKLVLLLLFLHLVSCFLVFVSLLSFFYLITYSLINFPPMYLFYSNTFFNKPESSKDVTVFIISFISLFDLINFVAPEPKFLFWITASAIDVTAVNHYGIKTLLAIGLALICWFSLNNLEMVKAITLIFCSI